MPPMQPCWVITNYFLCLVSIQPELVRLLKYSQYRLREFLVEIRCSVILIFSTGSFPLFIA